MPLPLLIDEWRRATNYGIARHLSLTDDGLILGAGTLLAEHFKDAAGTRTLAIDGREEQILALISVAYWGAVSPRIIENIRNAAQAFARGEKAIAHFHLAFTGLHGLEDEEAASFRLFLAERLLAAGLTPEELLREVGIDPEFLLKGDWDSSKHPRTGAPPNRGYFAPVPREDKAPASGQYNSVAGQAFRMFMQRFIEQAGIFGLAAALARQATPAATIDELIRMFISTLKPTDLNEGEERMVAEARSRFEPPKTLAELQPWSPTEAAGTGYQWHHIVEANPDNIAKFGRDALEDPSNLVRIPTLKHEAINAYYNGNASEDGPIRRVQINQLDFDAQREIGLNQLREKGVLK